MEICISSPVLCIQHGQAAACVRARAPLGSQLNRLLIKYLSPGQIVSVFQYPRPIEINVRIIRI